MVAELGQTLLGGCREAQRAIGIAFLESDARAQDVDDRAHAHVARQGGALAAAVDCFARGAHVAVLELNRRERLHHRELDSGVRYALEQSERALVVRDRAVELARVVQCHGDSHVALCGEAKLARARRHRERELVRRERFCRSMEPAVHGAEVNERPRAEAGVRNFALLHQVAGRLERLGARGKLAVLDVQDASGVQQLGKLGGIAVRVDKGHRFAQTFERLLSLALRRVGRSEETQQRGALGGRGLLGEGGRGLVTDGPPIAALEGGLGRETMEQPTFRAGQRLVADEVIEASPEPRGDDLERAEGGTNQPGLHLTNEALG